MAQFVTDFSEYPTSSPPSDWTSVAGSFSLNIADSGGQNVLQMTTTSASRIWNTASWDAAGTDAIVETVARVRVDSGLTEFGNGHGVSARNQTSGFSTHYSAGITRSGSDGYFQLSVSFGTGIDFGGFVTPLYSTWRWIRIRTEGTSIEMWAWDDGDSPKFNTDPPDYSGTDSTHASGGAGVFFDSSATSAVMEVSFFGVGMGGDEAPISIGGGISIPVIINHLRNQGIL